MIGPNPWGPIPYPDPCYSPNSLISPTFHQSSIKTIQLKRYQLHIFLISDIPSKLLNPSKSTHTHLNSSRFPQYTLIQDNPHKSINLPLNNFKFHHCLMVHWRISNDALSGRHISALCFKQVFCIWNIFVHISERSVFYKCTYYFQFLLLL